VHQAYFKYKTGVNFMKEQDKIRAYVCSSNESIEKLKLSCDTLVINIDSCLDSDVKIVEIRVYGKVHRYSTKQVSQFLDYITEGFFE
jgi:hypothetical protein